MQNKQTGFQKFTGSPEFKKRSTNIVEGTLKFIARAIGAALKAILNAFKMMVRMATGK